MLALTLVHYSTRLSSSIFLRTYHKVTLDVGQLVCQLLLDCIVLSALNLVVVVVQASNVGAGELGNLASRTTDATADIKNLHTLLDTNLVCEVVFVAGNSLVERLADGETTEVEGLSPSVLVNIGGKVVVAVVTQQPLAIVIQCDVKECVIGLTVSSEWHTRLYGPG